DEAFPAWLNAHALVRRPVGGEVNYAGLGVVDRYLVRRVAHITENIRTVKDEELSAIAAAMSNYLTLRTSSPKTSGR
ncbi:MAG TPA: hypothetical protein VMW69_09425, partial [Spirochaetia bacterium]|nr:hypothetical protein [Spirochaetia bacterium]